MLANRVRELTQTTGTGDITLAGALSGHVRFSDAFNVGDSVTYVIEDGDNYEIGTGTLQAADTLARTQVMETLVGGAYTGEGAAAINLSGNARIFCAATADFLLSPTKDADLIREVTPDAGVTVDGVHMKDGVLSAVSVAAASVGADTLTAGGATFSGDAVFEGQVTFNGGTVQVNSNEVNIGDSIIMLNADLAGAPTLDGGMTINRGTSPSKSILWKEGADRWEIDDTLNVLGNISAMGVAIGGGSQSDPFEVYGAGARRFSVREDGVISWNPDAVGGVLSWDASRALITTNANTQKMLLRAGASTSVTLDDTSNTIVFSGRATFAGTVTALGRNVISGDNSNNAALFTGEANRSFSGATIAGLGGSWDGATVGRINILSGADTVNKDAGEIEVLVASGGVLRQVALFGSDKLTTLGGRLALSSPILMTGTPGGAGAANRYISGASNATDWYTNAPAGGAHVWAVNETQVLKTNAGGAYVTGIISVSGAVITNTELSADTLSPASTKLKVEPSFGFTVRPRTTTGGWARGLVPVADSTGARLGGSGYLGDNETLTSYHIGFGPNWWGADSKFSILQSGDVAFTGTLTIDPGSEALKLKPGTVDHTYMAFYARTASPNTRSGYIGYDGAGTNNMVFVNALAGEQRFHNNGMTWLTASSTGAATFAGAVTVATNHTVHGLLIVNGGAKISVQNKVDGGSGQGIYLWDIDTTSYGIYMAQAGALKSLNDGTACSSLDGRTGYHTRIRVAASSLQAFIVENSNETGLLSLTADTGDLYTKGNVNAGAGLKVLGMVNLGSPTELTISAGAITVTKSFHGVDTEADAATDDLETINGGSDGDRLILKAQNDTRSVVLKDGVGNLRLNGDFTLDSVHDTIELIFLVNVWQELSRSSNS